MALVAAPSSSIAPQRRIRVTGRHSATPPNPVLTRACEYIEAQLAQPIRMTDVCRHAGISVRTLERMFGREMGMAPTQYILARRLDEVQRQLLAGDSQAISVAKIARDNGFTHLGRFSGQYRGRFGETPTQTLNKETARYCRRGSKASGYR